MNLNAGFPVLSFTTAIPKSPDSRSTFPGKAHPFVCIPLFSALIQQTLSPIISNADKKKRRQNFIDYSRLFIRFSFLKQEINLLSNSSAEHSLVSADKVLSSFLLVWIWNCERRKRSRGVRVWWWRAVKRRRHLERVFCALMYRCAAIRAKACSPARYPDSPAEVLSTHKFKFTEKTLCFLQLLLYKIIIKKTFMGTLDIIYTEVKPGWEN